MGRGAGSALAGWRSRRGVPLDVSCLPGVELLSGRERELCAATRLLPAHYLALKDTMLRDCDKNGSLMRQEVRHAAVSLHCVWPKRPVVRHVLSRRAPFGGTATLQRRNDRIGLGLRTVKHLRCVQGHHAARKARPHAWPRPRASCPLALPNPRPPGPHVRHAPAPACRITGSHLLPAGAITHHHAHALVHDP